MFPSNHASVYKICSLKKYFIYCKCNNFKRHLDIALQYLNIQSPSCFKDVCITVRIYDIM